MQDPPDPSIDSNWFESAFDALYPVIYAHRTVASALPESEFAAKALGIGSEDRVLDLCCGNGRHMVHLLRHSPHVFGLDYSEALLTLARNQIECRARLVQGDMRALPFADAFDAVANFFTSFGYFVDGDENLLVLQNIGRALKRDGRFFIDYLNPRHVEENLQPRSCRTEGDYEIIEERWIDQEHWRVNKSTVVKKGSSTVFRSGESVQLYTVVQMQAMLCTAGLVVEEVYGDYDAAAFSDACPRMILAGHKDS